MWIILSGGVGILRFELPVVGYQLSVSCYYSPITVTTTVRLRARTSHSR